MINLSALHYDNWSAILSTALTIDSKSGWHPYIFQCMDNGTTYIRLHSDLGQLRDITRMSYEKMPLKRIKEITQKILNTEPSVFKRKRLEALFQEFVRAKMAKLECTSFVLFSDLRDACFFSSIYIGKAFKLLFPNIPDNLPLLKQQLQELSDFAPPPVYFTPPRKSRNQMLGIFPAEMWVQVLQFFRESHSRSALNALLLVSKDMYFHSQESNKKWMYQNKRALGSVFGCESSAEARMCVIRHQLREINFGQIDILSDDLRRIALNCPRIQKVTVRFAGSRNFPSGFNELTHLKIKKVNVKDAEDALSFGAFGILPQLQKLSIDGPVALMDCRRGSFLKLTSLTLNQVCFNSSDFLSIGRLFRLTRLVISSVFLCPVRDMNVNHIYSDLIWKLPHLKALKISKQNLNDYGISTISTLKHLEKLDLDQCLNITGKGIQGIAEMKTLKFFAFHGCPKISAKAKKKFTERGIVEMRAECRPIDD